MTKHTEAAPALRGLQPTHPGEILREDILPALGRSKAEIVRLLGTSRNTLYSLLDGERAVSADMALRLGKLCGNSPEFWMNLQTAYDLAAARRQLGDKLDAIPTLTAA